jgi:hypothetical protein
MENKTIYKPYTVQEYQITPYYYLIPTGKNCEQCKCDTCTSIFNQDLFKIFKQCYNFFEYIFCCCTNLKDSPESFYR